MKTHDVKQGTPEWLNIRAGIPTASSFDRIVTPGGKPSKSAEPYMLTLLAERIMGHPVREHISFWMERGSQMEADAVGFYEFQTDMKAQPVGFITNDDETIGASPDRMVGEDGLLEIKCPSEAIHMAYLLTSAGAYSAYKVQVQGQLWVTGRKWVDVLSYHPELPEALFRVERDEQYIDTLAMEVTVFSANLERMHGYVLERGYHRTEKERVEDMFSESVQAQQIRILKETLSK